MNVAIVGYAAEGQASCEYYTRHGHSVTVCDQNEDIAVPANVQTQLGKEYLANLDRFDLVLRTAGMHPQIILDQNPDLGTKLTSQINEFLGACPTKNIIGVTGTKGKGTTSTLIYEMLKAAAKTTFLGGNIGVPVFSFIDSIQPEDWVVLELSSFQLIDVRHSPHIALCLMVVPEHLNWHQDLAEYLGSKKHLFTYQQAADIAIYYAGNERSHKLASAGNGQKIPFYKEPGAIIASGAVKIDGQTVCDTADIKLLGEHNWQNVCAAVTAVWNAGVRDIAAIRQVLQSFTGLEHRLEFVREVDGVRYFDDSFGTTPETAIVAIEAFEQPKVVILGGSSKESDYHDLAKIVAYQDIRQIILIGNTANSEYQPSAPAILRALKDAGVDESLITTLVGPARSSMQAIVAAARAAAKPGDVVLLSTGSASFDMFTDYKDRGNQFKQVVSELA